MEPLGPDELSELEEAIADACAEKRREGWVIKPGYTYRPHRPHPKHNFVFGFPMSGVCCPIGALCGVPGEGEDKVWSRFFQVAGFDAMGFDAGFDCDDPDYEASPGLQRQMFDMGRRFRERLEAGLL